MPDHLDGLLPGQVEDDAGGVAGFAPPVTLAVDGPGALHLEVGVQDLLTELHEQVLAVRPDPVHGTPGEIMQCHRRHTQRGGQHLPPPHELEAAGQLEYGITLWHDSRLTPSDATAKRP